MSHVTDLEDMPAEKAMDIACSVATTAREIVRKAEEQFAEAISRYNREVAGRES
jgi:hypothetical protein